MSTHQAVITPAKGQPIAAAAVPTAQPGLGTEEVLVTVQYAGLNPIDLAQMQDGKFINSYPYVLGKEWSGTVAATGSGVKDLKEGDSVLGLGYQPTAGGFQEKAVVSRAFICHRPSSLSAEDAASIPHTFATSMMALFSPTQGLGLSFSPSVDEAKSAIVVWGGSTATGTQAISALKAFGYNNIIAVASTKQASRLQSVGAAKVIDRSSPTIIEELKSVGPIRTAYVCQADESGWKNLLSTIQSPGRIQYIIRLSPDEKDVPDGIELKRTVVLFIEQDKDVGPDIMQVHLQRLLDAGAVTPSKPVYVVDQGKTLLERTKAAIDLMLNGAVQDKVVVKVA